MQNNNKIFSRTAILSAENKFQGAHIFDLETIGFVTSGLGQLSINDNWPRAQLALQTIGSMKPRKKQKKMLYIDKNLIHFQQVPIAHSAEHAAPTKYFFILATRVQFPALPDFFFCNPGFFLFILKQ